ncbi:MAG TPA: mechanosensitive ion channel family protein [Candidatus Saccharimonadales bacterium]
METLQKWAENTAYTFIVDHWVNLVGYIVVAILAYFAGTRLVGTIVNRAVKGARHREWHKKDIEKRQKTLRDLFRAIWKIIVVAVFVYAVLNEFFPNIETSLAPLFASAGIIGIALGFGAQSLIKDFLSGIFIISENQYRVGDVIDIEGFSGTVERIGTRSTVLRDTDGNVHYFPNGMVQHVINKTLGFSMARFTLQVVPTTDIDKLSDLIDEVGAELAEEKTWKDKIIKAPAFVSLGDITGISTEVIIAGKTQPSDQWAVTAEMRKRLHGQFEKYGIELAVTPTTPGQPKSRRKN